MPGFWFFYCSDKLTIEKLCISFKCEIEVDMKETVKVLENEIVYPPKGKKKTKNKKLSLKVTALWWSYSYILQYIFVLAFKWLSFCQVN